MMEVVSFETCYVIKEISHLAKNCIYLCIIKLLLECDHGRREECLKNESIKQTMRHHNLSNNISNNC